MQPVVLSQDVTSYTNEDTKFQFKNQAIIRETKTQAWTLNISVSFILDI